MVESMSTSVSSLKPIHLLRALLREASYLPDATARTYFRHYIVNRFKAHQPKENAAGTGSLHVQALAKYRHRSFRRRKAAVILERTRPLLRRGQKGLNFLRRANVGELPCLQKVLYFAYGRLGKRRHALLCDLLKPVPNVDGKALQRLRTDDLAPLQQLYYSNKRYLQYFDAPKASSKTHFTISISNRYPRLRTVIKSQYEKGLALHRDIKSAHLKTPINNVWERPMPIKRARNNIRRWYAVTLDRLLPPLPAREWDDLRSMIAGEKHISLKRRRVPALPLMNSLRDEEDQFRQIISQGITLDKPSRADKPAGTQRPHNISLRFMRRLYTKLLALSCKLEYDSERKVWRAVWGEPKAHTKARVETTSTDDLLFGGVDAKGCIPRNSQTRQVQEITSSKPKPPKEEYVHFPFYVDELPSHHPIRKELDAWKKKRSNVASGS